MLIAKELILLTARKIASDLGHTFIGIEHFNTACAALTNTQIYIQRYQDLLDKIGKGTPYKFPEMNDELALAYCSYPNIVRIED